MSKRNKKMWVLTDGKNFYSFDIAKAMGNFLQASIAKPGCETRCHTVHMNVFTVWYLQGQTEFYFTRYNPRVNRRKSSMAMPTCDAATKKANMASSALHADRSGEDSSSMLSNSKRNARPFRVMDETTKGCMCFPKSGSLSMPASASSRAYGLSSSSMLMFFASAAFERRLMCFLIVASLFLMSVLVFVFMRLAYELLK